MTENQFQKEFINERFKKFPNHVFVPFVDLKYSIGKYHKKKDFGMPDFVCDVIEFDEDSNFHLWELKKINSPEVWNGKFFGQIMVYDYLFSTEPWNELVGRFAMRNIKKDNGIKGDIGKILIHLGSFGKGEVANKKDKTACFKSWNLVVCGGDGCEIAAGYNPMAWSLWVIADIYFKDNIAKFNFHQFCKDNSWELITLPNASIYTGDGLTENAITKYKELGIKNP